jgi:ABC-type bacteriocin/lantibiotic exporter with double-glycine peptidase domain
MVGYSTFPREFQLTTFTCGPCSTYAICVHFGVDCGYFATRAALRTTSNGTRMSVMRKFLQAQGLEAVFRHRMSPPALIDTLRDACVVLVGLDGDHCGVVYGADEENIYLADPSARRQFGRTLSRARFMARWDRDGISVRPRRQA